MEFKFCEMAEHLRGLLLCFQLRTCSVYRACGSNEDVFVVVIVTHGERNLHR